MPASSTHLRAVLQGLLVTFFWSTSFILIKIGLRGNLPPLSFAGLRYFVAFLCLVPFVLLSAGRRRALLSIPAPAFARLSLLGVVYITATQGLQFVSLKYLPAASVSLILNFTPLAVGIAAFVSGSEKPSRLQWIGLILTIGGALFYFLPTQEALLSIPGLLLALLAMLTNAAAVIIGRHVNRDLKLDALLVTSVSMGIGASILLGGGLAIQGLGTPSSSDWLIVLWLAAVNTAFAFTLWNRSLQTLNAVEASALNSTMLPQIALLAWLFLGESLNAREVLGLATAATGVYVVQMSKARC